MHARRAGLLSRGAFLLGCLALLGSCRTAGFREVFMSSDPEGKRKTDTFPTTFVQENSGIYCHISYSAGRDDAELKTYITTPVEDFPVTLATGADGIFLSPGEGNELVLQLGVLTEGSDGKPVVQPAGPWEIGEYKLDFYIDDKKEDSISFTVKEPEASEPPPE